jgi:putative FmdB family regulatory protein
MPTYQYRCKQCDHELEVVQSFSDEPLTTCPECEGALKKVYGNVGISFKGSGFYKTDSRGGSSKKAAAPKSDTSSDSTTTTTKSESSSGGEKAAASSTPSTSSSD